MRRVFEPSFSSGIFVHLFFVFFTFTAGETEFSWAHDLYIDKGVDTTMESSFSINNFFDTSFLNEKQDGQTSSRATSSPSHTTTLSSSLVPSCFNESSDSSSTGSTTERPEIDEICRMSPRQIIEHHGYKLAEVKVVTQDDYILTMWRICKRGNPEDCQKSFVPSRNKKPEKYPVLLQHGLFSSGEDWLYLNENSILPLMLVNAGYDVYIGNSRGNKYSQGHLTLNSSNIFSPYWTFSVHEMGVYDVPASIDKILGLTQSPKINYIGYSMGTTMFVIMKSEREEYLKKVERFVALAPAMYIGNFSTQVEALKCVLKNDQLFEKILPYLFHGDGKFGAVSDTELGKFLREVPVALIDPLQRLERLLTGMGASKFLERFIHGRPLIKNKKAYQCALSNSFLSGASRRTVRHYYQFQASKKFQKYDYQLPSLNKRHYGQPTPPEYNRKSNTTVQLLVLYGEKDSWCTEQDMKRAAAGTGHWNRVFNCSVPCFHHLDFVYGPNKPTKQNVYDVAVNWLLGRNFKDGQSGCTGDKFLNKTDYCYSMVE